MATKMLTTRQLLEQEDARRRAENEKVNNSYMTEASAPAGSLQYQENVRNNRTITGEQKNNGYDGNIATNPAPTNGTMAGETSSPEPAAQNPYSGAQSYFQNLVKGNKSEGQIYADTLSGYQNLINLNEQNYAQQIKKAREQANSSYARERAMQAKSGGLTTSMGTAVLERAAAAGNQNVLDVMNQRDIADTKLRLEAADKASGIYDKQQARELIGVQGLQNIAEKNQALSEKTQTKVEAKQKQITDNLIASLSASGQDVSAYTDEDWQNLADKYGADMMTMKTGVQAGIKENAQANLKSILDLSKEYNIPLTNEKLAGKLAAYEKLSGLPEGIFKELAAAKPNFDYAGAIHGNATDSSGKDFVWFIDPKTGKSMRVYTGDYTAPKNSGENLNELLSPTEAAALGVSYGTTKEQAMKKGIVPQGKATQAQQTVAGYAARIEQSEPILTNLQDKITNTNLLSFETQIKLPSAVQSPEIQQYMQSSRNFINSVLRRESGAVISPSEFAEARKQYLPQPGDTAKVLKQKADNRKIVLENYKNAAGSAYESVDSLLGNQNNDRITVISPDGKEGTIPANQLQEALNNGYKQK